MFHALNISIRVRRISFRLTNPQYRNGTTRHHKDAKFASLFELKSEMKINRNRIQNSCAYFSFFFFFHFGRFCFDRARFPFANTSFDKLLVRICVQTNTTIIFDVQMKIRFFTRMFGFRKISNYVGRIAVVRLIGQMHFSDFFACIELEIDCPGIVGWKYAGNPPTKSQFAQLHFVCLEDGSQAKGPKKKQRELF